jgi:hypothetical protein
MSFLSNGLNWLQDVRHTHCTETIRLGLSYDGSKELAATISQDEANSTQDRVTLQKQVFHFIVRRSDLINSGVKLQRGVKIWYNSNVFELAYEGRKLFEYNDPMRNDLILRAVLVQEEDGLSPAYNPS